MPNGDYEAGGKAGSSGKTPISRYSEYIKGYIEGLKELIEKLSIPTVDFGSFRFPDLSVLETGDGLEWFIKGMALKSPEIVRDYFGKYTHRYFRQTTHSLPEWRANLQARSIRRQRGYELGFAIRIAMNYNIAPHVLQIPVDNEAYNAFMTGLKGDPKDSLIDQFLRDETSPIHAFERIDNHLYDSALALWLKGKGIDPEIRKQIQHPTALRAFKVALEGRILPVYEGESEPLTAPVSLLQEAMTQGRRGYELGKEIASKYGR